MQQFGITDASEHVNCVPNIKKVNTLNMKGSVKQEDEASPPPA
jgi:hypothetical protein